MARAHFNLAGYYQTIGLYIEATAHLNDARFTLESNGDKAGLSKVYNLLGHIRFELETFDQAMDWYRKGLKLNE